MTTETDQLKKQTEQLFNFSEKPIMEYVCNFLNKNQSSLFIDKIPDKSDPLILLPIDDYKKNVYISFTLKTVYPNDTDEFNVNEISRISALNDIIKYERVKESIGFIVYCIKTAFPSIIASGMIDNKPMINTFLELNENKWALVPIFNSDLTIKKKILEETLTKIMFMKQDNDNKLTQENLIEINIQLENVINKLTEVNNSINIQGLENEKKINIEYTNKPFIGIFVEEISEKDLPVRKNTSEQKYSNLKSISTSSYSDPI